jgi:hypothetical protein
MGRDSLHTMDTDNLQSVWCRKLLRLVSHSAYIIIIFLSHHKLIHIFQAFSGILFGELGPTALSPDM